VKAQSHNPKLRVLICAALGLITLVLYLPVLSHGFVEYDDQQYVTDNPRVQAGLTWTGLGWAFGFTPATGIRWRGCRTCWTASCSGLEHGDII